MQFSDQMWEEIRKLKLGGVTWELLPKKEIPLEIPKVIVPSSMPPVIEPPKPPEPIIVPEVIEYNQVIPAKEEVIIPKKVRTPKKEKNETPTVQKKRATHKRSKGNAKK